MPFDGTFSLSDQLRCKAETFSGLDHDWFVHQDADEILEHRDEGKSLLDAFLESNRRGYNAINFDEFVFLPIEEPAESDSYRDRMRHYYFYEPKPIRLIRAWKRTAGLQFAEGGHRLVGKDLRVDPVSHNLRHYIGLSQAHLRSKYLSRRYAVEDYRKGWHGHRVCFTETNSALPSPSRLLALPHAGSKAFRRDRSEPLHYWEWF